MTPDLCEEALEGCAWLTTGLTEVAQASPGCVLGICTTGRRTSVLGCHNCGSWVSRSLPSFMRALGALRCAGAGKLHYALCAGEEAGTWAL